MSIALTPSAGPSAGPSAAPPPGLRADGSAPADPLATLRLPALRDDLALLPAPAGQDGAPGWTIHDPVRNRYFRIGPEAFALIAHWHHANPRAIAAAVEQQGAATRDISANVHQAAQGAQAVSVNVAGASEATTDAGAKANEMLDESGLLTGVADRLRREVDGFLESIRAA